MIFGSFFLCTHFIFRIFIVLSTRLSWSNAIKENNNWITMESMKNNFDPDIKCTGAAFINSWIFDWMHFSVNRFVAMRDPNSNWKYTQLWLRALMRNGCEVCMCGMGSEKNNNRKLRKLIYLKKMCEVHRRKPPNHICNVIIA